MYQIQFQLKENWRLQRNYIVGAGNKNVKTNFLQKCLLWLKVKSHKSI